MHIHRCRAQNPPAGLTKRIYIKLYIKKKRKEYGALPRTHASGKYPWTGLQNCALCFSAFGMVHTKNMHGDRNKKKRKEQEGRKKKTKKRIEKGEKKERVD